MAADEAKRGSGYNVKFLTTPSESLICGLCQLVANDPQLSVCCGTNFCKACLEGRTSEDGGCPTCYIDMSLKTFPNKMSRREILKLVILCHNSDKGCEWQGDLADFEDHLTSCELQDIECVGKCGKIIARHEMDDHLNNKCQHRQVKCEHCQKFGEYHMIIGQHTQQCPKLPLSCPNECGSVVVRSAMEEHLRSCPLRKTNCKYHNIGCEVMVTNQDEHDEACVKEHFHLMRNELIVTKEELVDSNQRLSRVMEELRNDFETKLQYMLQELDQWKDLSCAAISGTSPSLDWPNRVAAAGLLLLRRNIATPVTVQLADVSQRKARDETFESPPFYTHYFGYKVCLMVTPNGVDDCKHSHLSVTIRTLNGPNDAKLSWPLKGRLTVSLLNQVKNSNHVCQVLGVRTIREPPGVATECHCKRFISHKQLFTSTSACNYYINDVMYFEVVYSK